MRSSYLLRLLEPRLHGRLPFLELHCIRHPAAQQGRPQHRVLERRQGRRLQSLLQQRRQVRQREVRVGEGAPVARTCEHVREADATDVRHGGHVARGTLFQRALDFLDGGAGGLVGGHAAQEEGVPFVEEGGGGGLDAGGRLAEDKGELEGRREERNVR